MSSFHKILQKVQEELFSTILLTLAKIFLEQTVNFDFSFHSFDSLLADFLFHQILPAIPNAFAAKFCSSNEQ